MRQVGSERAVHEVKGAAAVARGEGGRIEGSAAPNAPSHISIMG